MSLVASKKFLRLSRDARNKADLTQKELAETIEITY